MIIPLLEVPGTTKYLIRVLIEMNYKNYLYNNKQMEDQLRKYLYNKLIKLSDDKLFKLVEDNNFYNDYEMRLMAQCLDVEHDKYNNINIEREIIFDIINKLLRKNKNHYDIHELINVRISEKQLEKSNKRHYKKFCLLQK